MIRAFLAVRPTQDVIQSFLAAQTELDEAGADVRWVSPDAVHLTISSSATVRESECRSRERPRAKQARCAPALRDRVPRPRDVPEPDAPARRVGRSRAAKRDLSELADVAETVLSPLGFPPEERDLHAAHHDRPRALAARRSRHWSALSRRAATGVRRLDRTKRSILYRSQLRSDGAVYAPLVAIAARAAPETVRFVSCAEASSHFRRRRVLPIIVSKTVL